MSVSSQVPIHRYTGNGVITTFAFDFDLLGESVVQVLIGSEYVDGWTLQNNSVVFDVAPDDGAEVIIFRRTLVHMPENYTAFGRFPANKTELSVDRAIMIAQEHAGERGHGQASNGIVGGANLYTRRNEFDIDVISERGDDVVVPHWLPDDSAPTPPPDPDPTILWAGADIVAGRFSLEGNVSGVEALVAFWLDDGLFHYDNFNATSTTPWLDHAPADGDYWMRITELVPTQPKIVISDGTNHRASGEAFPINRSSGSQRGSYITVYTIGDVAPATRQSFFQIEICKDNGNGLPDGGWTSRNVSIEAIFNLDTYEPPPQTHPDDPDDPVDVTGAIAWGDFFFGHVVTDVISDDTQLIPPEGQAIWFTIPADEVRPIRMAFGSIETWGVDSARDTALNITVGDFTTPPTFTWGNGTAFNGGINQIGVYDIDLIPGNTYIWNVKNNDPANPNWMRLQAVYIDET